MISVCQSIIFITSTKPTLCSALCQIQSSWGTFFSFDKPVLQAEINISYLYICAPFSPVAFQLTQRCFLRSFLAVSYPKILQNSLTPRSIVGRMGRWKEKGRSRLGRTKFQEKNSGLNLFSYPVPNISVVPWGKEEKSGDNNCIWLSSKFIFIPKLWLWGVCPPALHYLLDSNIWVFLWKQGNWLGRGRREVAAVPAHSPSWSSTQNKNAERNFLLFTRVLSSTFS